MITTQGGSARGMDAPARASAWRVSVGGRVYGPYSDQQMRSFVSEGRIAAHSIVTQGDGLPWVTAIDDPVLGPLFNQARPDTNHAPAPNTAPAVLPVSAQANVEPRLSSAPGMVREVPSHGANFIIIAEIKTRSAYAVERELEKLGECYRLNTLTWVLHTEFPVGQVRNSLTPHLGKTDTLMVVDSTNGKSAWFNLGPEAEAKIRKIWRRGV